MTGTAINSREEHSVPELKSGDPALRLLATSSPSWDMVLAPPTCGRSLPGLDREEVARNLDWARACLRHCLSGTPHPARLLAAVHELRMLRQSCHAWQDVHSDDKCLLQAADAVLTATPPIMR